MRLSWEVQRRFQAAKSTNSEMGIAMKVNLQQKEDEEHYRGRLLKGTVHNVLILMASNERRFRTHKYFFKKISTILGTF